MNAIGPASLPGSSFQSWTKSPKSRPQPTAVLAAADKASTHGRSSFSTKAREDMITAGLRQIMGDLPGGLPPQITDGLFSDAAKKQASGEPLVMIVVKAAGGGGMAVVMTKEELAAKLASDDPRSFGSITTDGKCTSFLDAIRAAFDVKVDPAAPPESQFSVKNQVAAAVAKMLEKAAGKEDVSKNSAAEVKNSKDTDNMDAPTASRTVKVDGSTVSIIMLPGVSADMAQDGSGALLDTQA